MRYFRRAGERTRTADLLTASNKKGCFWALQAFAKAAYLSGFSSLPCPALRRIALTMASGLPALALPVHCRGCPAGTPALLPARRQRAVHAISYALPCPQVCVAAQSPVIWLWRSRPGRASRQDDGGDALFDTLNEFTDISVSRQSYVLSRYPVLKIHPTIARHMTRKRTVMAKLTPTLTSAIP